MRPILRPTTATLAAGALALALALGCGDGGNQPPDGTTRPESALHVVQLIADSVPIAEARSVSFPVVKGQTTQVPFCVRTFLTETIVDCQRELAELKFDGASLKALPDGTLLQDGDTVTVTVTIENPRQLLFKLEPSGLQFNVDKPAELRVRYDDATGDFNHDGKVDGSDGSAEQQLAIWRQEKPGEDFTKIGTARIQGQRELRAELTGFSRYAISY